MNQFYRWFFDPPFASGLLLFRALSETVHYFLLNVEIIVSANFIIIDKKPGITIQQKLFPRNICL